MRTREPPGCNAMARRARHFTGPIAVMALCLLGVSAASASASALKLQLISNGQSHHD